MDDQSAGTRRCVASNEASAPSGDKPKARVTTINVAGFPLVVHGADGTGRSLTSLLPDSVLRGDEQRFRQMLPEALAALGADQCASIEKTITGEGLILINAPPDCPSRRHEVLRRLIREWMTSTKGWQLDKVTMLVLVQSTGEEATGQVRRRWWLTRAGWRRAFAAGRRS